jgi:uncharacterized caspase-like protein
MRSSVLSRFSLVVAIIFLHSLHGSIGSEIRDNRFDQLASLSLATSQNYRSTSDPSSSAAAIGNDITISQAAITTRRVALIVGNSAYSRAPRLANPAADAKLVADALAKVGFKVIVRTDLSRREMNEAFRNFADQVSSADVGLFYYAGHGLEAGGENYILPIDSSLERTSDVEDSGLPLAQMLEIMESSVPIRILLIDACRDNPFLGVRPSTRAVQPRGLAPMRARLGTFIGFSTAPGGQALDGSGSNSPFATAVAQHLGTDGLQLDDWYREVRRTVADLTNRQQIPWSASSMLEAFYFAPLRQPQGPSIGMLPPSNSIAPKINVEETLLPLISDPESLINGQKVTDLVSLGGAESSSAVSGIMKNGVNWIQSKGRVWTTWFEEYQLRKFDEPYNKSFAIVAAVDQYGPPQNFPKLSNMVSNAQELIEKLVTLGFPRENIVTLFDEKATSTNIETALKDFWEGGPHEDADRLVFYFGGHGARMNGVADAAPRRNRGVLITSDYRPNQPSRTGIVLDDLMTRHFANITSRHVLALIDACSSGLALPAYQTAEDDPNTAKKFAKLATLRAETTPRARDLFVAGTNDERALWDSGGIFTRALINALNGAADWNNDGLIQFSELILQVRAEVIDKAAQVGVRQTPDHFSQDKGRVLFVRSGR